MKNVHSCPKCESSKAVFVSDTAAWGFPWEPYQDDSGVMHQHDPNKHFNEYKCENGHIFEEAFFPRCACGWQAENY